MVHERRCVHRWCINSQAKVKLKGQENMALCQLKDINFKGTQVFLGLGFKLPKDTFLPLRFVLPDENILDLEAWIVWHKIIEGWNIYGLYFSRISDQDKEKVYQFVRKSYPKEITKHWWEGLKEEKGGEIMNGSENGFKDRRVFERFPAKMSLRFLNLNTGKEGYAYTRDFSAKGLGLVSSHAASPRSLLEIWLDIPDKGQPLYTRGEVVWAKCLAPEQYRMGISLEKADLLGLSRVLRT